MILFNHFQICRLGVGQHLLRITAAGDDTGHSGMLQTPGQGPLGHGGARRHFCVQGLHLGELFVPQFFR